MTLLHCILLKCMLYFGVYGDDPDKLDALFGIVSAEKTLPNLESASSSVSLSLSSSSSLNSFLSPSVPGEFILYVDESTDVIIITCEVSLPSKDHSLHLLCPLVPETRLCFENCRRVCSLADCTDKPKLFTVECVEDLFVRDMYNIWKFRYIIDRHEAAVEGTWGCFHAGKSTETVNVTATLTTTAEPIRKSTAVDSGVGRTPSPWLGSFVGQLNSRGSIRGNNRTLMTTQQQQGSKKNYDFDKAVVMVLIIFLSLSISINIIYAFISSCKKEKNSTTTPSTPMVIAHDDQTSRACPRKNFRTLPVLQSADPSPFPSHQLQPPAFLRPNDKEHVNSNNINGDGLYVLHSNSLQTPTTPQSIGCLARQSESPPSQQLTIRPPSTQPHKTIILRPMRTHSLSLFSPLITTTTKARQSRYVLIKSNTLYKRLKLARKKSLGIIADRCCCKVRDCAVELV
ncbi:hypothetical protein EmuJ_000324700 [Echinococcus multilocularis]|uniref:Uncharacterized protein n=1 Tax=Echinococcus multilocularis TaxID=6211 RepID=A0A068Y1B4_ECHMU|nr:hypothetical protein EmuJ_000324700 [Echinococcus multilocularis]